MPGDGEAAAKRHAPATLRNRDAIRAVLAGWLPASGIVLEVASGSGAHIVHFAASFPDLAWPPRDHAPPGPTPIAGWPAHAGPPHVPPPPAPHPSASSRAGRPPPAGPFHHL